MSSRRSKITLLKQKICMMQNQLIALTQNDNKFRQSRSHSKSKSINSNKGNSRNREFHSPTFCTNSQIHNQDKYSPKIKQIKDSYDRKKSKNKTESRLSPQLKSIINTVNTKYYVNKSTINLLVPQAEVTKSVSNLKNLGQRFQFSSFGVKRDEKKNQKIKTYYFKKTDIIMNPKKQKQIGVKMVQKIQRSPERMLTDNPESNPLLYFYDSKPLFLERKGRVSDQNKSLLSFKSGKNLDQEERTSPKPRKSQKKHFAQYFQQNLFSQIY